MQKRLDPQGGHSPHHFSGAHSLYQGSQRLAPRLTVKFRKVGTSWLMVLEDEKSRVQGSVLPPACNLTALCLRETPLPKQHTARPGMWWAGEPVWLSEYSTKATPLMSRMDKGGIP